MSGERALLCPQSRRRPVELSGTMFRKQVLRKGSINYRGRTITFDDNYMTDLAKAYREGAFDQVAFLLAGADNLHTMDPERFRGEVKGLEVTKSGLDAILDLTPDAADLVRKNPKLGVSARIIEGLEHADGRAFPRAVQHVLGTLDPKVTGMAPWQEVALSEEVGDTIDMTTEEVTTLPEGSGTSAGAGGTSTSSSGTAPPTGGDTSGTGSGATVSTPAAGANTNARAGSSANPTPVSDIGNEPDFSDVTDDDISATERELVSAGAADLSGSAGNGNSTEVLLAADRQNRERIQRLEVELAGQRFDAVARQYVDAGVPPVLVELARPLLSLPATPVIDLANGSDPIDVAQLVKDILDHTKGFIELGRERGSYTPGEAEETRADQVLVRWKGGSV